MGWLVRLKTKKTLEKKEKEDAEPGNKDMVTKSTCWQIMEIAEDKINVVVRIKQKHGKRKNY